MERPICAVGLTADGRGKGRRVLVSTAPPFAAGMISNSRVNQLPEAFYRFDPIFEKIVRGSMGLL
jgi:hypothetical protein